MNYQKPMMGPVSLQTEAASCSPCVLLTVTPPALVVDATVGNQRIHVDGSSVVGGKSIVVTSPTSGGCPNTPQPGTPQIGGIDAIQLPRGLGDLVGVQTPVAVDVPIVSIAHLGSL